MSHSDKCLIWNTPAEEIPTHGKDSRKIDSPRAGGKYSITRTAIGMLDGMQDSEKSRLTTWLIDQRNIGIECPEITSETITNAKSTQPLLVIERANRLLKYFEKRIQNVGDTFSFPAAICDHKKCLEMMAWSESTYWKDINYLIEYLIEQKWVECLKSKINEGIRITVSGYVCLAELEKTVVNSSQAFVAMWFDKSLKETYENGIKPAVESAGYRPLRIDQKEHINRVDDEIIAEIKRSRFVIADFTQDNKEARGGVYYEAGFAHGLNIPVIYTCRKDCIENIHFDTRQFNHIVWENPEDLLQQLTTRILAVIGEGPHSKKRTE